MAFVGCINLEKFEGKFASEDGRCLIVNGTLKAFAPFESERPEAPEVPKGLSEYHIPDEVTAISDGVFAICYDLKNFTGKFASADGRCLIVNDTLKAFAPRDVKEYTIPAGVTAIAPDVFLNCFELKSIMIGAGVTSIGNEAFGNCQSLKTATVCESVATIGQFAFFGCDSLERFDGELASADGHYLVVNDTLKAFAQGNLTEFTIPDDVTVIGESAFYLCKGLKSVTIGESVTTIAKGAFELCDGLTSVTIGSNVTTIGDGAFRSCSALKSITVNNPNPVNVGVTKYNDVFYEVDCSKCTLYVPSESVGKYKTTEGWNAFGTILPIGASSITETQQEQADGHITVYNLQGVPVLEADDAAALKTLQNGAYIVNGKTMIIAR